MCQLRDLGDKETTRKAYACECKIFYKRAKVGGNYQNMNGKNKGLQSHVAVQI